MTLCVGNARAVVEGDGMMIRKQESGVGKIDPLIATFNEVTLMSLAPEVNNYDIDGYLEDIVIA